MTSRHRPDRRDRDGSRSLWTAFFKELVKDCAWWPSSSRHRCVEQATPRDLPGQNAAMSKADRSSTLEEAARIAIWAFTLPIAFHRMTALYLHRLGIDSFSSLRSMSEAWIFKYQSLSGISAIVAIGTYSH